MVKIVLGRNNNKEIFKRVLNNITILMQPNKIDNLFGGFSLKKKYVSVIYKDNVIYTLIHILLI